jgi:hypothetical protein
MNFLFFLIIFIVCFPDKILSLFAEVYFDSGLSVVNPEKRVFYFRIFNISQTMTLGSYFVIRPKYSKWFKRLTKLPGEEVFATSQWNSARYDYKFDPDEPTSVQEITLRADTVNYEIMGFYVGFFKKDYPGAENYEFFLDIYYSLSNIETLVLQTKFLPHQIDGIEIHFL